MAYLHLLGAVFFIYWGYVNLFNAQVYKDAIKVWTCLVLGTFTTALGIKLLIEGIKLCW